MLMVFEVVSLWKVISIRWGHVGGPLGGISGLQNRGENLWVDKSYGVGCNKTTPPDTSLLIFLDFPASWTISQINLYPL